MIFGVLGTMSGVVTVVDFVRQSGLPIGGGLQSGAPVERMNVLKTAIFATNKSRALLAIAGATIFTLGVGRPDEKERRLDLHSNESSRILQRGPAQFRGWAQGVIAPPPGYTLTGPELTNAYGNITSVACGSSFRADTDVTDDEFLSVTFVRNDLF